MTAKKTEDTTPTDGDKSIDALTTPKRTRARKPAVQKVEEDTSNGVATPVRAPEPDGETVVSEVSEKFYATPRDYYGRSLIDIAKKGWVGPAPLTIGADEIDELVKVLQAAKKDAK